MDIEALEKLQQLKEKGIITDKEFQQQKTKILKSEKEIRNNYQPVSGCAVIILILLITFVIFSKYILFLLIMLASN